MLILRRVEKKTFTKFSVLNMIGMDMKLKFFDRKAPLEIKREIKFRYFNYNRAWQLQLPVPATVHSR